MKIAATSNCHIGIISRLITLLWGIESLLTNRFWKQGRVTIKSRQVVLKFAFSFKHLSPHSTVKIGEYLFLSFLSFTFNPKILQSFFSPQLTTRFCHVRPVRPQNCCPLSSGKCRYTILICCNAEWAAILKQMFLISRYCCSGCFKFLCIGGTS